MNPVLAILLILVGLASSFFFAGIETGMISLNRLRLRHDVERRHRRAIHLNGFLENSEQLLGTTLVGNNLSNVLIAVGASSLAAGIFGASYAVELATTIVTAAVVLVVGEISPKSLFRRYSYRLCMSNAYLLKAVAWLFAPVVLVLGLLMRGITRLIGTAEQPRSFFVTREELKHLSREGETVAELTTEERQMIAGVFDFPFKTVFEVMVPLGRTVTISSDTSIEEVLGISERTGYARFPVRDGNRLVGIVNTYEILFEGGARDGHTVERFIRKPQMIPATERVDRVLPVLRASRIPISVVVNPDGRHVGIITIEDIVEEIVGDVEG